MANLKKPSGLFPQFSSFTSCAKQRLSLHSSSAKERENHCLAHGGAGRVLQSSFMCDMRVIL